MMMMARRVRGFSQTGLAKALGISQAKLSKIETGLVVPDDAFLDLLGEKLSFHTLFFKRDSRQRPPPPNFHRKRQKLGAHEWETILARSEIYQLTIEEMLHSVELQPAKSSAPQIDPDQFDGNIERVAVAVRQAWMVPRGPIQDMTKLIEDAGIIIVSFDFGTELIDAFCQHTNGDLPPMIFLNSRFKGKDRIRFSLAHELAHLVMHRIPTPTMEDEANIFAAAFLMPTEDIRPTLYNLRLDKFMELKLYWKTSMQAIIRRARDLNKLDDRRYKYFLIEMGRRGWRSNEPIEIVANESPKILKDLFQTVCHDLSAEELGNIFGLLRTDLEEMYPRNRPKLRLITSKK